MNAPGKLEKGLAIVLLLLSTGAFLNLFLKHGKFRFEANAGLPFMQVIAMLLKPAGSPEFDCAHVTPLLFETKNLFKLLRKSVSPIAVIKL